MAPFLNTYTCTDCGQSYPKTQAHECNPKTLEDYQVKRAWQKMGGEKTSPIDEIHGWLTPRLQKHLDFYEYLRKVGRL